jgi:AcrR family transcriptional regulator
LEACERPFIVASGGKPYRRCGKQRQERRLRKGEETRGRILEIAEAAVLAKGFGATSIEEIIAEAGITKSGFFYHFRDKNELARAMIIRSDEANRQLLETTIKRAEQLADKEPLQTLLIGLKLFAETMSDLPNGHPGCLIASITYQERLFDREVVRLMKESVQFWNDFFAKRIEAAAQRHGYIEQDEVAELSRMIYCIVDGGIVLGRALLNPNILPEQILMVRCYIKMLFQPVTAARRAA